MPKTVEMAKTAEMARTGLESPNSDNPLALVQNKGQGGAGTYFYDLFPERQLNFMVICRYFDVSAGKRAQSRGRSFFIQF